MPLRETFSKNVAEKIEKAGSGKDQSRYDNLEDDDDNEDDDL